MTEEVIARWRRSTSLALTSITALEDEMARKTEVSGGHVTTAVMMRTRTRCLLSLR